MWCSKNEQHTAAWWGKKHSNGWHSLPKRCRRIVACMCVHVFTVFGANGAKHMDLPNWNGNAKGRFDQALASKWAVALVSQRERASRQSFDLSPPPGEISGEVGTPPVAAAACNAEAARSGIVKASGQSRFYLQIILSIILVYIILYINIYIT